MNPHPLSHSTSFRKLLPTTLTVFLLSLHFPAPAENPPPEPPPAPATPPAPTTYVPTELFTVPDGLEVTLWASSPMLYNPTNIDFDAQGRLYVAEGVNYRGKSNRRPEGDRIVVLEDTTGSGHADRSTVFVQAPGLAAPLGVAVFENRLVVSQPPDLLVYTDTNRDGKFTADSETRDVLLTGFSGRQHDHSLHSVTAGPDGLWYWNQGNTGAQFTDRSLRTFRMGSPYQKKEIAGLKSDDGHVWVGGFAARMQPDGKQVEIIAHNFRNSYEQAVTSLGDIFQSDNDDPPACRVTPMLDGGNAGFASADGQRSWEADKRPGQPTPIAEWRQEDPGTMPAGDVYGGGSPTGVAFYENGALGSPWSGLLLACEAGKNVIFGYLPKPDGAGFKLERFDFMTSNKERRWAGSDFLGGRPNGDIKTKFRPSDVCVGPDGAIYVADWFDPGVGGHNTADAGYTGAIYRIAPKGFKSVIPKIDLDSTEGQIAALKSPAVNVRQSGFIRLRAQGPAAIPAVKALLENPDPFLSARAIWLLAQMGDPGQSLVLPLLTSKNPAERLVAFRALRRAGRPLPALATQMATDPDPAVRREVATSLRDLPADQSLPTLLKLANQWDGADRSALEAIGIGSLGKEAPLFAALTQSAGPAISWSDSLAGLAWRLHPDTAVPHLKARALATSLTPAQRKLMLTALAFIPTREAAGAMIELAYTPDFPLKDLANWWLLNRKNNLWKPFDVVASMRAIGGYDPQKVQLIAFPLLPIPPNAPPAPTVAEILLLQGDRARGETAAAVCSSCHRIGSNGIDYGPDLTAFGKQQSAEIIAQAIAQPSASISHGFEGSEVKTKSGLSITGMIISAGDPLIIKCLGGVLQTIPQNQIQSVTPLSKSLMSEPSQIGLNAQSIADIVAYLKSL